MGLSIYRSIIEAHGGRLWGSLNELPGAVFQFTLPLELNEAVAAERADPRLRLLHKLSQLSGGIFELHLTSIAMLSLQQMAPDHPTGRVIISQIIPSTAAKAGKPK
ncbi:hypothetical protein [Rhizobium mesoamericanum]|uniref:hypothetical protein n=1 Tax=Rhizobium mesoamericanum TaxID=1079800 RepID=UPI0012FA7BB6